MDCILTKARECGFSFARLADNFTELATLQNVLQNPQYHAEGDVFRHTEMVCETLVSFPEWQALCSEEQEILLTAAAFHDIGKPICTKLEDGQWVSPKHTIIGEKVFRRMAYQEAERFGLTFAQRELLAKLIRFHGLPVWFWKKKRMEFDLLKAAESIPLRLLYLLSKADVLGRIAGNRKDISGNLPNNVLQNQKSEHFIDHVELFGDYAKELGIWENAYNFTNSYSKFQYFHKNNIWQGAELFDNTTFDVYLMAGLPLSGKDSWITKNGGELPVISLDAIREELGFPPTKKTQQVVHIATERARKLLRSQQPFIWNATNIIAETRQKLILLFAGYGARVHIIYLEVPYRELLRRNQKRERYIPEKVLEDMIRKLEVPAPWEGFEVLYL